MNKMLKHVLHVWICWWYHYFSFFFDVLGHFLIVQKLFKYSMQWNMFWQGQRTLEWTWKPKTVQTNTTWSLITAFLPQLKQNRTKKEKMAKAGEMWKHGVLKTIFLRNIKRCPRRCIFGKGGLWARREVELLWPWESCACFLSDIPDSWVGTGLN